MAKKVNIAKQNSVKFDIDPFLLPSTQHKAGLAGLLITIDVLKNDDNWHSMFTKDDEGIYHFEIEKQDFDVLYDKLFDVCEYEYRLEKEPQDGIKFREAIENNKTVYYITKIGPSGEILKTLGFKQEYVDCWRRAILGTYRANTQTQNIFEEIFKAKKNKNKGYKNKETELLWDSLINNRNMGITGKLIIGGEATNTDGFDFTDTAQNVTILYFAPLVAMFYMGLGLAYDKKTNQFKFKDTHYVVVLPDIYDYDAYIDDFKGLPESERFNNFKKTPKIVLPQQGALDYYEALMEIIRAKSNKPFSCYGMEYYCTCKKGKTGITISNTGKIKADDDILIKYKHILGTRSNFFKRRFLLNLFIKKPWYYDIRIDAKEYPTSLFTDWEGIISLKKMFNGDELTETHIEGEDKMAEVLSKDSTDRIYKIVEGLVSEKMEEKTSIKRGDYYDSIKKKSNGNTHNGNVPSPKTDEEKKNDAIFARCKEARDKICDKLHYTFRDCQNRQDFNWALTHELMPQRLYGKEAFDTIRDFMCDDEKWLDACSITIAAINSCR